MRSRRKSWITHRAIGTSPVDVKEYKSRTSFPFSPLNDSETRPEEAGNPEQGLGLERTSQAQKVVCKAIVRHPEHPNLVLFGLRRDDEAWCVPGGHAEEGEDPTEAMHREFIEECGQELSSVELVHSVGVPNKGLTVHVFEGVSAEPNLWLSLDGTQDPDSEFLCYQYIDPLDTDLPLHIPVERNAVVAYLSQGKTGYMNSLRDMTTEKEARHTAILRQRHNDKTNKTEWALLTRKAPHRVLKWFGAQKPSKERVEKEEKRIHFYEHHGQAPDLALFKRTDESKGDAYHDENQFEDADMHLGSKPYDSNGTSPADEMRESLGEEMIVQYASKTASSDSLRRHRRLMARRPDLFARKTSMERVDIRPDSEHLAGSGFTSIAEWEQEVARIEIDLGFCPCCNYPHCDHVHSVSMSDGIEAVSTENSKGLGVELDNKREDIALMKDLSVRTPVGPL